jgi:tetratricopeptide (TPR) repeat protein
MSYIIEALKKAQKEKDSHFIHYVGTIKGNSEERRLLGKKILYFSLSLLVLISLVFMSFSWLDLPFINGSPEMEKESAAGTGEADSGIGIGDLFDKAGRLYKDGSFTKAKDLYEAALSLDPGYVEALNNLGVIYVRDKDYIKAKQLFEKAVRLKPSYVEPYYNMACLHAIRGESVEGLTYLKKALSIDSGVKAWARDDSDLDGLRTLPEFAEIISE